jgi:hypothetical protein
VFDTGRKTIIDCAHVRVERLDTRPVLFSKVFKEFDDGAGRHYDYRYWAERENYFLREFLKKRNEFTHVVQPRHLISENEAAKQVLTCDAGVTVAVIAPDAAFPANLSNRPVHAANGGIDPLYPSALQKMFIDQLREQGVRIAWTDYPASGHDGSYMEQEDPKVNQFLLKTVRDPAPKHLVWETASPKVGRCDWVRIDEVRDVGNNRGPEPSNLILTGPPQFAVGPDMTFAGPGLRLQQVPPGTLSQTAGLKPGDVGLADRGKMTGRPAALESLRRPARFRPPEAIGCWPLGDRQRTRLARRGVKTTAVTAIGDRPRLLKRSTHVTPHWA